MKRVALGLFFPLLVFGGCGNETAKIAALERKVDSLQQITAHAYVPGFGEFMSGIQIHHAKLWFAGKNENWELADFEVQEIIEMLEDVKTYQSARPESEKIDMIEPALDSVTHTIDRKDLAGFELAFRNLTATCNNCHRATDHAFNVVKIPDSPPFDNQVFTR